MCCDSCEKWIHILCDHRMSEDEYDHLVQNPFSDPWFCSACIEVHTVVPPVANTLPCNVCVLMLEVCFVNVMNYLVIYLH